MDDWYGHDHRGESSSWHRIFGDGQPSDYSAGSSAAGDWHGPRPEPLPEDLPPDLQPDPVPRVFREAFDVPPPVYVPTPRPVTPEPVRFRTVDPIRGFRAFLSTARRNFEDDLQERDR